MPHLLNVWPAITAQLQRANRILALFDYDGTLTPIAPRPQDAILPQETHQRLTALTNHPRYITCLVSGRSLTDLETLTNIPNLIRAGNHGLEIRGPNLTFTHPGALTARNALTQLHATLTTALAPIPGIIIEDKTLTLTVHYRTAPPTRVNEIDAIVTAAATPHLQSGQLRLTRGKMVIEIRPALPWHKGKAIEKIRQSHPDQPLPIYFGDDQTDEDGFRATQAMGGIAVFIGPPRQTTNALHRLESPQEVSETLQLLLEQPTK